MHPPCCYNSAVENKKYDAGVDGILLKPGSNSSEAELGAHNTHTPFGHLICPLSLLKTGGGGGLVDVGLEMFVLCPPPPSLKF
jgi:hypothetical protein